MNWPRGKYNGQRIVGFRLVIRLNVFRWKLAGSFGYSKFVAVGPFIFNIETDYES